MDLMCNVSYEISLDKYESFVCLGPVLQYVLVKIDHSSYTIKIK